MEATDDPTPTPVPPPPAEVSPSATGLVDGELDDVEEAPEGENTRS